MVYELNTKNNDECKTPPASASQPLNDLLKTKLGRINSLIRLVHLDMGGADKYHISQRNHSEIGRLIKECIMILDGF